MRLLAALSWTAAALLILATVSADTRSRSPFVEVCGMSLCVSGRGFTIHGGTAYGQYDNPVAEVALAKQAGLNVLEIVEYETRHHELSDAMSEATWTRVDDFIAVAKANGLRVILNFSSYGQSLQASGIKPTTADWRPFLSFVTNRVNTKTGIQYSAEPAIAMYELLGEIDAPNYDNATRGTTAETTAFFRRTLAQLKALDPNHLVSSGGMSYINDPDSGIDWQKIMAEVNNDACDVEINSLPDRNISVPSVSSYCRGIGKPWFLAAWSACQGPKTGPHDIDHWPAGDPDMATHALDMYQVERNAHPAGPAPAVAAVGSDFWNLAATGTCALGPAYPQTFAVVERYAAKPAPPIPAPRK
ncbi:hypothetical protein GCM10023346_22680 [Arthrobacter gyeryongensis]|uniref:mannan endo-1,4-beta-mannosidase n=1 Tax=Arthrobacter gyeryongensis TaxID=1650592 RepID=A0ABP9SH53_9MICC